MLAALSFEWEITFSSLPVGAKNMSEFNLIRTSLILISIILGVSCEKFSAISEMERLAYDEDKIIQEFTKFADKMENEVKYMQR